jgi:hypothetical protein
MYTAICAELGATIAVASSAPYIEFSLISYLLIQKFKFLRSFRVAIGSEGT